MAPRCWFSSRRHRGAYHWQAMTLRLLVLVGWARRSGGCWSRMGIVSPLWPVVRERLLSGPSPSLAQGSQRRMTRRLDVVQTGRGVASRHQMMPLPPPPSTWRIVNPLARGDSLPLQRSLEFDGVTRLEAVRCPGRFHASLICLWYGHC